jgi:hypothetical protein
MPHRPQLPTEDDLNKLPLRAIVAYAARCARRVQPLFRQAAGAHDFAKHAAAVEQANSLTEWFCLGRDVGAYAGGGRSTVPVARAAARATIAAARAAARAASAAAFASAAAIAAEDSAAAFATGAFAAAAAADAVAAADAATAADSIATDHAIAGEAIVAAAAADDAVGVTAASDYARLRELNLGCYPELGPPLDPTEQGPLGPLWTDQPPQWFTRLTEEALASEQALMREAIREEEEESLKREESSE